MSKTEEEMNAEALKKAQEVNEARNNDRLKLMEQIADSSEMARAEDFKDPEVEEAEAKAKALQEEGAEAGASDDGRTAQSSEVPDEKDINGVRHYLQVVNGREKWMTLREIRERASKVEAADEYLQTAAEAARKAAELAPSHEDEQVSLEEDEARKILAAAVLGDEEAIGKLAKAITARPSQQDVLQAFDQRLSFRTELAALEAESQDLLKDPYMGRLFRARLNELKTEAPNTKLSEAYHAIDKELRTAFPGFKGSKAQEKLERKRTLTQVPSAAARQQTETEEEGEEDPSQVIEAMAKKRGFTPHVHPRRQ